MRGCFEMMPQNEKGPDESGPIGSNLICALGAPMLLLLFCRRLFLRGGLLGCALHRLILPKHQILRFENRNVIHI
jgi:hypothetical protein